MYSAWISIFRVTLPIIALCSLCIINTNAQELRWRASGDISDAGDRWDGISFVHPDTGWAAGTMGGIQRTYDGGNSWQDLPSAFLDGVLPFYRTIAFASSTIGWVGCLREPMLRRTTDGGDSWIEIANLDTNIKGVCGLQALSTSTVYGVGAWSTAIFGTPHFIKSTNGGETFNYRAMNDYTSTIVDLNFSSNSVGMVGGSVDGGPSDGKAIILRTTDAGATWQTTYRDTASGTQIWKFYRLNSDTVYAAVQSFLTDPASILISGDNGLTWKKILVADADGNSPSSAIQAVGFVNGQHGWVGGRGFNLFETTDGGNTWRKLTDTSSSVNKFQFFSDTLGYAGGRRVWRYKKVDTTTSVNEPSSLEGVTKLTAHVESETNVVVRIENSTTVRSIHLYSSIGGVVGQLIGLQDHNSTFSIPTKRLSTGMYIVVVMTDTDMHVTRFMR